MATARTTAGSRWPCAAVLALSLLPTLLHLPYFAGDTVIHFIFAENAASGDLFQFNRGEASGGETSPGYMLLIAALLLSLGAAGAAISVKLLAIASWFASLALVWLLARRLFDAGTALLATAIAASFPGSGQNALLGMENVHFATAILLWLLVALAIGWFGERSLGLAPSVLLGLGAGATTWIRPESIPFFVIAGSLRLARSHLARRDVAAFALGFAAPTIALILLHLAFAGHWPWSAGVARANLSAAGGLSLGPLVIHGNVALRLIAYLPLSVLFVTGARALRSETDPERRGLLVDCAVQVAAFFVLYSTILSSTHLARYTIFVWPLFSLVAALGISRGADRWREGIATRWRAWVATLLVCQSLIFAVETSVRLTRPRGHRVMEVARAPEQRRERTDHLLRRLAARPAEAVVVASVEVQLRYFWDDRITVRSLDGIVDRRLADFFHGGNYDHVGYLRDRHVTHLLSYPNFNRDRGMWSLARIRDLPAGESLTRDGLRFVRLAGGTARVEDLRSAQPSGTRE